MSGLIMPNGQAKPVIPVISESGEGGVVDVSSNGRTVTINLSAANAISMREVMVTRNPIPTLLALLQVAIWRELERS